MIELTDGSIREERALIQRVDRLGDVYDAASTALDAVEGAERLFNLRRQECDDYLIDFISWLVRRVEIANVVADRSVIFADRDDDSQHNVKVCLVCSGRWSEDVEPSHAETCPVGVYDRLRSAGDEA